MKIGISIEICSLAKLYFWGSSSVVETPEVEVVVSERKELGSRETCVNLRHMGIRVVYDLRQIYKRAGR